MQPNWTTSLLRLIHQDHSGLPMLSRSSSFCPLAKLVLFVPPAVPPVDGGGRVLGTPGTRHGTNGFGTCFGMSLFRFLERKTHVGRVFFYLSWPPHAS